MRSLASRHSISRAVCADRKGEATARRLDHLKKADMAEAAERVLAGTGWLPALLRTPGLETFAAIKVAGADPTSGDEPMAELPTFLTDHDEIDAGEGGDMEWVYGIAAE